MRVKRILSTGGLTRRVRSVHNDAMSESLADYVRRHTALGLARRLGVAHTTVLRWLRRGVPPHRLAEVSRATGIPAEALRPDLAAAFARDEAAASE